MKDIFCDPDDILPALGGSHDFYWPGHPEQTQKIFAEIETALTGMMKNGYQKDLHPLSSEELMALLMPLWMQVVSKLLTVSTAIDKAATQGYQLHYSPQLYPFWNDYQADRTLPDQPLFAILSKGPVKPSFWRWPQRIIKSILGSSNIRRYPPSWFNLQTHTAVTSNEVIVSEFCKQKKLAGFYIEPDAFFTKLVDEELQESAVESAFINQVTEQCLGPLEKNQTLRQQGKLWLRRQIAMSVIYTQRYIDQALKNKNDLPRQLVSNLGGVWNGLLRYAVKKSGGTVHVIDHGCGSALYKSTINSMTNLSGTSIFYAFSPMSEKLIRENLPETVKSFLGNTIIKNFPHREFASKRIEPLPQASRKKLLVVPLSPVYDRGLAGFYPSTLQALDFNARLIQRLQEQGWDVTLKPHPAFMEFPPEQFMQRYGAPCETHPFEQIFKYYDAIISCDFTSSTLAPCLYSHKPLIFFDQALSTINSEVLQILRRRAEIHDFSYSENGHIEIQWDNLANMLEAAMVKTVNHDFIPLFQESQTATSSHG